MSQKVPVVRSRIAVQYKVDPSLWLECVLLHRLPSLSGLCYITFKPDLELLDKDLGDQAVV